MADEINNTEQILHDRKSSTADDASPNYLNGNDLIDDDANENTLDPLLVDEENSNIDSSPEIDYQEKPVELKAQRELDEDEIPPPVVPTEQIPIEHETSHSRTESESNITDDRPLTELETPYEHHEENETSPVELSNDQSSSNNHSFVEIEQSPELIETDQDQEEEEEEEINQTPNESITEENIVQEEFHLTKEDFPPLSSPAVTIDQTNEEEQPQPLATTIFKEEEFPPLPPPEAATIEQTKEEIISLPEPEDILGNKTLIKQIIEQGTPSTHPTRSTLATVTYTLSLIDNFTSNVRIIETVSYESFFVSECDTIPAIDLAVQFMNRGERAIIDADIRHGYGELGYEEKQIPSINSTTNQSYRMKIDLELHDWKSPPNIHSLSVDERLFWGDKKRQMGNFYYRRRDYSNALQCYRGALRFLDVETNPLGVPCDDNQRSLLTDSYIQVQNNVAQVNLFLNKYDACLNAVENVLKYDPKNVKALFRQGKALFELGKYDQALQPLKSFAQLQRGNSNAAGDYDKVTEMITTCENKLANYQKNEKEIYRRMFQPAPSPPATTNQQRQTKATKKTDTSSSNTLLYIGLGGAALAAIGIFTFMKYRKTS